MSTSFVDPCLFARALDEIVLSARMKYVGGHDVTDNQLRRTYETLLTTLLSHLIVTWNSVRFPIVDVEALMPPSLDAIHELEHSGLLRQQRKELHAHIEGLALALIANVTTHFLSRCAQSLENPLVAFGVSKETARDIVDHIMERRRVP